LTLGTNYYAAKAVKPSCDHCGRFDEDDRLHIGKSSAGWCFGLHIIPERGLNSLADWKQHLSASDIIIEDDYGNRVSFKEMISIIAERHRPDPPDWDQEQYATNHAEPGPNNMIRHKIGQHCIGHGDGSWDLIPGYFS
jgi:hypothetical protein